MREIQLEQTLHGYDGGHRLLSSSVNLSTDAERAMTVLSDMSGPSIVPGFDTYLTGYPLAEEGFYAFARTWYANEKPRPGCVWTHTLLIRSSDLGSVESLGQLEHLFRRPGGRGLRRRVEPILLRLDEYSSAFDDSFQQKEELLSALYESVKPVIVGASQSRELESLVLAVWSQQWPRLRRNFAFCTGALGPRDLGEIQFDLLIVPHRRVSRVSEDVAGISLESWDRSPGPWAEVAAEDLAETHSALREFLWEFGADAPPSRRSFVPLVRSFGEIDKGGGRTVMLLAEHFPGPVEAIKLKATALERCPRAKATEMLAALASLKVPAFSEVEFDGLVSSAWKADKQGCADLVMQLMDSEDDPGTRRVLEAIVRRIGAGDLRLFRRVERRLLPSLVRKSPVLATSSEIWKGSASWQQELLSVVLSTEISEELLKEILVCLIEESEAPDEVLHSLLSTPGEARISLTIDLLSQFWPFPAERANRWKLIFRAHADSVVEYLARNARESSDFAPARISTAVSVLAPDWPAVRNSDIRIWVSVARAADANRSGRWIHATLLAVGFLSAEPDAAQLVSASFPHVYRLAANDEINFDAWRPLDYLAPSRAWFGEWDKCLRLSVALVERFVMHEWPPSLFLAATLDADAFEQSSSAAWRVEGGPGFFRKMSSLSAAGELSPSPSQKRILDRRW